MSDFKPFTGKNLDEAIAEAVKYLGVERDKLEIEIIHGGSSGIFGLVGKRKAEVRARKRPAPKPKALDQVLGAPKDEAEPEKPAAKPAPARAEQAQKAQKPEARAPREETTPPAGEPAQEAQAQAAPAGEEPQPQREPRQGRSRGRGRGRGASQQAAQDQEGGEQQPRPQGRGQEGGEQQQARSQGGRGQPREDRPRREPRPPREPREPREPRPERAPRPRREEPVLAEIGDAADQLDLEREDTTPASDELLAMTREIAQGVLSRLLDQDVPLEVSGTASRLTVTVVEEEHSGLLIGREGATLQALQYVMTRMLAKKCDQPVKVSLNAGEYREKQDLNLKKTALFLAEKAKTSGRPQSTKPLSSYHRRVVHLALQEDPDIVTRSKGDSALKRVIILPRKKGGAVTAEQDQAVEE